MGCNILGVEIYYVSKWDRTGSNRNMRRIRQELGLGRDAAPLLPETRHRYPVFAAAVATSATDLPTTV